MEDYYKYPEEWGTSITDKEIPEQRNVIGNITLPPKNYGWICPKCGRVYSPITVLCHYCRKKEGTECKSSTIKDIKENE